MPWWGWILAAALLLGAELVADAQFYLVFLGVAALIVGLAGLAGFEGALWEQWLAFGFLSLFSLVFFRARLYERYVAAPGIGDPLIGEVATVADAIAPGATGAVELRGSRWQARNAGREALASGERARVESVKGLVVHVRKEGESATD